MTHNEPMRDSDGTFGPEAENTVLILLGHETE